MAKDYFIKWIEGQGIGLRQYLNLSPYCVLDPFKLAEVMGVHVLSADDLVVHEDIKTQLLTNDPKCWDAGCIPLPENRALILYNPTKASTRIHATIMEELSHLHLKHKGSKITSCDGICYRSYNKSHEKQAYAVGAAALLPQSLLMKAKKDGKSKRLVASECGVSPSLVLYRVNISRIKLT